MEGLTTDNPSVAGWQRWLWYAHDSLARVFVVTRRPTEALEHYRQSLTIRRKLINTNDQFPVWQRDIWFVYDNVGRLLMGLKEIRSAIDTIAKACRYWRCSPFAMLSSRGSRTFTCCNWNLGMLFSIDRRFGNSLAAFLEAVRIADELAASEAKGVDWRWKAATSRERVGDTLAALGRFAKSLESFRLAVVKMEAVVAVEPANATHRKGLADLHDKIARLLAMLGKTEEAEDARRMANAVRLTISP